MQKPKKQSIKSTLSFTLSLFAISPFLILGALWIFSVYKNQTQRINGTYQKLLKTEKQKLRTQVYNIHHFIEKYDNNLEHNLYSTIQKRNKEAYNILKSLYFKYKDKKNITQVKTIIKEALRPIRYHGGKGYYFIVDTHHTEILYPTHPEYEGRNLFNLKDSHGTFVIQKEVELAQNVGEGFVTDYWPKPGAEQNKAYPKISHIKIFKPLGWVIGTGLYLDDYRSFVQDKILEELTTFDFFNKEKNFFLDRQDGVPLIFNGRRVYNQKSLINIQDENGIFIYKRYKAAALSPNGDFFYYHWKKSNNDIHGTEKLSFAYHYRKWNWIFGAGTYLDKFHKNVQKQEQELYHDLYIRVFQLLSLILVLLLIIIIIVRKILLSFVGQLTTFTEKFQNSIESNELLDLNQFKFSEFKILANSTNINILKFKKTQRKTEEIKLLQERNARFISLGEMAGGIAHEINNPLLVIKGYISLLKKKLPSNQHEEIEKIDSSINRISSIIQGFKELTSMPATQLHKKRVYIDEFFKQIKPMVDIHLVKHNVKLQIHPVHEEITVDTTLLGQIITNLIHNSVYAIKNRQDRWIDIRCKITPNNLFELKIKDSGLRSEIPNPQIIFEPLITNKPPGEGTGLGLSLSKNMARRLGGDLVLDLNEANTTFVLTVDISD